MSDCISDEKWKLSLKQMWCKNPEFAPHNRDIRPHTCGWLLWGCCHAVTPPCAHTEADIIMFKISWSLKLALLWFSSTTKPRSLTKAGWEELYLISSVLQVSFHLKPVATLCLTELPHLDTLLPKAKKNLLFVVVVIFLKKNLSKKSSQKNNSGALWFLKAKLENRC